MMAIDLNDFLRGDEIMDAMSITNKSTLCKMTKHVKKEEIEKNPEIFEKYLGKKFIALKEAFGRGQCRYLKKFATAVMLKQIKQRDIKKDLKLIDTSKETVDILGINALGPLHSGREKIIKFLKCGGNVRILILNPSSVFFRERERKEEFHNGIISGRLHAEYTASIGICKDIINFSNFNNNFEVKLYNSIPTKALLISDGNLSRASLNCNIYPLEDNVRGLMGSQKLHVSKRFFPEQFDEYNNYFTELWDNGISTDKIESFIKKKGTPIETEFRL